MNVIRSLLVVSVLGAFGAAIVGCEAHGRVGDPDPAVRRGDTVYKKEVKTVREPDGDVTRTETEIRR